MSPIALTVALVASTQLTPAGVGSASHTPGGPAVIVTGDDDLLSLEEYEGIAIVMPRAFLEMIAG